MTKHAVAIEVTNADDLSKLINAFEQLLSSLRTKIEQGSTIKIRFEFDEERIQKVIEACQRFI